MADMDYSMDFQRLQIISDFHCEHGVEHVNMWDCKGCKFYYQDVYSSSECVKRSILDWTLYHMETENTRLNLVRKGKINGKRNKDW